VTLRNRSVLPANHRSSMHPHAQALQILAEVTFSGIRHLMLWPPHHFHPNTDCSCPPTVYCLSESIQTPQALCSMFVCIAGASHQDVACTQQTHAPLTLCLWFAASSTESEQLGTRKWEEGVSQGWEDGADCIEAPPCSCTLAGIHPTILLVCYTLHQANWHVCCVVRDGSLHHSAGATFCYIVKGGAPSAELSVSM